MKNLTTTIACIAMFSFASCGDTKQEPAAQIQLEIDTTETICPEHTTTATATVAPTPTAAVTATPTTTVK